MSAKFGFGNDKVEDGRKVEEDRSLLFFGCIGGFARGFVGGLFCAREAAGAAWDGVEGGCDASVRDLVHHPRPQGRVEHGCRSRTGAAGQRISIIADILFRRGTDRRRARRASACSVRKRRGAVAAKSSCPRPQPHRRTRRRRRAVVTRQIRRSEATRSESTKRWRLANERKPVSDLGIIWGLFSECKA